MRRQRCDGMHMPAWRCSMVLEKGSDIRESFRLLLFGVLVSLSSCHPTATREEVLCSSIRHGRGTVVLHKTSVNRSRKPLRLLKSLASHLQLPISSYPCSSNPSQNPRKSVAAMRRPCLTGKAQALSFLHQTAVSRLWYHEVSMVTALLPQ